MASLNGFAGNVSGTTGSTNVLEPKSGWRVYVLPRGIHASAASTGTLITVDSAAAASRVSANQWVQVGTDTSKIVQVGAVGGNSFSVGSAVVVAQNDRILVIGNTQPSVTGGSASYQPHTTIYPRDDDASTPTSNSVVTTSSDGLYEFWAADQLYDLLVQDANRANSGILADVQVGNQPTVDFTPVTSAAVSLGTCALPFNHLYLAGKWVSGITSASGRTMFDFRTCEGITQGNLFAFGVSNQAPKVYGDTHGGVFQSWSLPEVFNVKSARFGAKGDGTTDDTTAISNAITAATGASDGSGGIVYFPPGIYIINSALTITTRVRLVGAGDRISCIRAGGSFSFNGTTDALVVIGSGPDAYGTIENLQLDCNNVANSICIYSADVQERGGPRDCLLVRYRNYGIYYAAGCQNTTIERCDFAFSASSTTAIGIYQAVTAAKHFIRNCTFNSYDGAANSTNAAIYIDSGICSVYDCHFEHHLMGVKYVNSANGIVANCQSTSGVTTLAVIGNGVAVLSPAAQAGTNVIGDNAAGITITSLNAGGWYFRSNDGTNKDIWSSVPDIVNLHGAPTTFGTTLTTIGTFTGSSAAILTCGTVTTLPAGNLFGISSAPAGATTVTGITPLTNGRRVTFIGQAGTVTFANGTGLKTGGPAVAAGECIELVCWGTTWHQVAAKL